MQAAPTPANEAKRLQALRDLCLLDTKPEERFDRVVRFAAEQLDMPIALVSLVDDERQWFKSRIGLDAAETARDVSFCGHAILQPDVFIVEDAQRDPRFADNPLVTGDPQVRFYAGAPLTAPHGERIGTLCVIDHVPRRLDAVELAVLDALRRLVNEALVGGAGEAMKPRSTALPRVLLVEPHFVLRRTIVTVATQMSVADLQEATNEDAATALLAAGRFDGLVIDLASGAAAIDLLARLRRGELACDAAMPVVGLTSDPSDAADARCAPYALLRLLRKPFKVGELLQAMRPMAG